MADNEEEAKAQTVTSGLDERAESTAVVQTETAQPPDSGPTTRDLYDWASRLTAESLGADWDFYWTPSAKRLLTKLQLMRSGLVGVVGVQGSGKSSTMRALANDEELSKRTVAVKVPESGGLMDAFKAAFADDLGERLDRFLDNEVVDRLSYDAAFYHRAMQLAKRTEDEQLNEQLYALRPSVDVTKLPDFELSPALHSLISKRHVRELEDEALHRILSEQGVIMIDMPDYPKHDRRLIARDLDDIQGLWNRLIRDGKHEVVVVLFLQKETINYGDHFLYGKMSLVDLMPLTMSELLEAYRQRWQTYAPFSEEALQYIARMSRGVFRRFKRYIGLVVEMSMTQGEAAVDVKKAVTDDEVLRDMDKELDGIFSRPGQKRKAVELIRLLSNMRPERERAEAAGVKSLSEFTCPGEPDGLQQREIAGKLDLSEMAVSRLVRELEQHGYVKRTAWQQWNYVVINW